MTEERTEAERLMSQLTHLRTRRDDQGNPEADTLLLEVIALMALGIEERLANIQDGVASGAMVAVAAMRSAVPIFRELAARPSEPQRSSEPTQTADDTRVPGSVAELVRGTHQVAGVMRVHQTVSGTSQFVEPGSRLEARPLTLIPGDVVTYLHEYPGGRDARIYLGHMSHPWLPDTETLVWWMDGGVGITPMAGRTDLVGIVLPSTDAERQERLKRWTEVVD